MQVIPLPFPLLKSGDDIAACIEKSGQLRAGDIIAISSKAVATVEGAAIRLSTLTPSGAAQSWSKKTKLDPHFVEAVLQETTRMNGKGVGSCPGALLTKLRPVGLRGGVLLVPNAGMDQSNVRQGYAIGWPRDPVMSVRRLRKELNMQVENGRRKEESASPSTFRFPFSTIHSSRLAVLLTDSCCHPGRLGVTAMALACSGIDPFASLIGTPDAFGRTMRITQEAVADQLATAANMVMGNAGQLTPVVIIRDHGLAFSEYEGWVPGMEPEEDLFKDVLK